MPIWKRLNDTCYKQKEGVIFVAATNYERKYPQLLIVYVRCNFTLFPITSLFTSWTFNGPCVPQYNHKETKWRKGWEIIQEMHTLIWLSFLLTPDSNDRISRKLIGIYIHIHLHTQNEICLVLLEIMKWWPKTKQKTVSFVQSLAAMG